MTSTSKEEEVSRDDMRERPDFSAMIDRIPGLCAMQKLLVRTELSTAYYAGCEDGREDLAENLTGKKRSRFYRIPMIQFDPAP